MIDKVQKIKEWIGKKQDGLMDAQGNFKYPEYEGAYHILCNLDAYIDSLQEELVSEDLEKEISFRWSWFCLNDKDRESFVKVAKHFFELGLKAKGEIYVVTRSEEHSDYVEAVFLNENKAEEYCNPFNKDEDCYARHITKVKIQ